MLLLVRFPVVLYRKTRENLRENNGLCNYRTESKEKEEEDRGRGGTATRRRSAF
jgi:hypothetical protein